MNELPSNARQLELNRRGSYNKLFIIPIILICMNIGLYYLAHIEIYNVSYLLPFICGQIIGLALLDKDRRNE